MFAVCFWCFVCGLVGLGVRWWLMVGFGYFGFADSRFCCGVLVV